MRIDYGYRRNGTRGFVQTLSVSRAPGDVKSLAYTVERIRGKVRASEFTAVTDVNLLAENERHRFVQETLRDAGVEAVPLEGLAVWTAKMRPMIQRTDLGEGQIVNQQPCADDGFATYHRPIEERPLDSSGARPQTISCQVAGEQLIYKQCKK